jgi:transcriptional regulator with XRE-family HTH domain
LPEARNSMNSSPTVRRRELGALLRSLRNARGMTVEQVAGELLCSPSKVSRMETGHRGATARDIRDLCDLYGVTEKALRDRMTQLAVEGKQPGWWQPYELDFATYVGLETAAVSLSYYMSSIVPGILQTPEYARAMHLAGFQDYSDERINEHVEVRMRRQGRLTEEPPLRLSVVLDEAVLHRVVGGPAVMAAQLGRLVKVSKLPHIEIQVITYETGAHPAMESNFNILQFDLPTSSVVYVEGLVGWIYLDRPQDLDRYWQVFERLRTIALKPKDSIGLISEIARRYEAAAIGGLGDADGRQTRSHHR